MTRPHIIRADTIDLQSPIAPSAKDHSRQPTHPAPLGDGPPAPHQAIALKQAEQDVEFHPRSPRMSQDLSNKELQLLHDDSDSIDSASGTGSHHDLHDLHRNGGPNGGAGEGIDGDDGPGDDGSEDEMMDKISSSPSIEDGGYHLPLPWPSHSHSLSPLQSSSPIFPSSATFPSLANLPSFATLPSSTKDTPRWSENPGSFSTYPSLSLPSSSASLSCPEDPDLASSESKDHHQKGEYANYRHGSTRSTSDSGLEESINSRTLSVQEESIEDEYFYDSDLDIADFHRLLIPANDAILDNSFDDASLSPLSTDLPTPTMPQWTNKALADDDPKDFSFSNDSRFIDSGWGGECLRELEDIDFAFVYALHTFIANVEGQANATKGDTMVLLDDSNSYWWLVRVVKDGSIGYLPAEHIETPTERLARLNKHRNIDLSQTMLGDSPEKSKNPLKKAMRRRNAKAVQFAPPTYFEPPNVEYSTEEEVDSDGEYITHAEESSDVQDGEQEADANETATAESSKSRTQGNDTNSMDETQASGDSQSIDDQRNTTESERTSDDTLEPSDSTNAAGRSRKGTVRNTDSFFKDDNMETRKINLTPSLLRDDSSGSTVKSTDGKEQHTRGSLDSLDKPQATEKGKEEKKRKEKKSILGGLFKRKEKKMKGHEEEMEESKRSLEEPSRSSPQPKESSESLSQENQKAAAQSPQRQVSKLQKAPPAKVSTTGMGTSVSRTEPVSPVSIRLEPQKHNISPPNRAAPSTEIEGAGLTAASRPDVDQAKSDLSSLQPVRSGNEIPPERTINTAPLEDPRREALSATKNAAPLSSRSDVKQETVKPAQQLQQPPPKQQYYRMALDEVDSSSEAEGDRESIVGNLPQHSTRATSGDKKERLSESPVDVAPPDQLRMQNPPGLVVDTSSQEDPPTMSSSPASSAELIEASRNQKEREVTPASTSQSSSHTATWSGANLRAYLEDDSEIRDLLTLVKDKSDMKPPSRDHPLVKDLFKDENQKLADMSKELDGLLGDFLERRAKARREKPIEGISQAQF